MRVQDRVSFDILEQLRGLEAWIVEGPQGEFYGRYTTYPRPDQVPLYAMVKPERPDFKMSMMNDAEIF